MEPLRSETRESLTRISDKDTDISAADGDRERARPREDGLNAIVLPALRLITASCHPFKWKTLGPSMGLNHPESCRRRIVGTGDPWAAMFAARRGSGIAMA